MSLLKLTTFICFILTSTKSMNNPLQKTGILTIIFLVPLAVYYTTASSLE